MFQNTFISDKTHSLFWDKVKYNGLIQFILIKCKIGLSFLSSYIAIENIPLNLLIQFLFKYAFKITSVSE